MYWKVDAYQLTGQEKVTSTRLPRRGLLQTMGGVAAIAAWSPRPEKILSFYHLHTRLSLAHPRKGQVPVLAWRRSRQRRAGGDRLPVARIPDRRYQADRPPAAPSVVRFALRSRFERPVRGDLGVSVAHDQCRTDRQATVFRRAACIWWAWQSMLACPAGTPCCCAISPDSAGPAGSATAQIIISFTSTPAACATGFLGQDGLSAPSRRRPRPVRCR